MKKPPPKLPPGWEPFKIDPTKQTWDLKHDRTYKIPPNYGIGIKWHDKDGRLFESTLSGSDELHNGKRKCRLEESNLLFSIGASHYYAKIEAYSPGCYSYDEGTNYCSAGYGKEREDLAGYLGRIVIEAQRRLVKVEKDMAGERIGKKGDWTYRFNSEAEAREAAIRTFKERFAPGWILFDGDDCTKVIAET